MCNPEPHAGSTGNSIDPTAMLRLAALQGVEKSQQVI
jgi:hypothetical protein